PAIGARRADYTAGPRLDPPWFRAGALAAPAGRSSYAFCPAALSSNSSTVFISANPPPCRNYPQKHTRSSLGPLRPSERSPGGAARAALDGRSRASLYGSLQGGKHEWSGIG